ncbi:MAG: SDR family oxidoreductase [Phycisphaerae bacterium]
MFDLRGKRALVCGSTQGIGRATAELLAKQGAQLTLVARDESALHAVHSLLDRSNNQSHDAIAADFRDPDALRTKVQRWIDSHGAVHILVNNTGGPSSGPILNARPDEFLSAMTMHVLCNHALVQTIVPSMRQAGFGRIINIISTSVREPIPGLGVSNTTRWAVAAWAKTMARELAPFGITVNNVLPGFTSTSRLRELFKARAEREGKPLEEVERATEATVPMGRFARPEEIAAAVAFLASSEASYVTGINLPVDGGRLSSM